MAGTVSVPTAPPAAFLTLLAGGVNPSCSSCSPLNRAISLRDILRPELPTAAARTPRGSGRLFISANINSISLADSVGWEAGDFLCLTRLPRAPPPLLRC